jgi:hypothetical protein
MLPTVAARGCGPEVAGSSTSRRRPPARHQRLPAASLAPQRASDGLTPPPRRSFSVASVVHPHRPWGERLQVHVSLTLDRLALSLGEPAVARPDKAGSASILGWRLVRMLQRAPHLGGAPPSAEGGETEDGRHAGGARLRKNRKQHHDQAA